MSMNELDLIAELYMNYYNIHDTGCWTKEKALKRIRQFLTIEDSLCLIQYENNAITGFLIGYFKEYDDLRCYFLEEIVILKPYQNKGYGFKFLNELEKRVRENNASHIELLSLTDEHHIHFYKKFGMYAAKNLALMGKHFEK